MLTREDLMECLVLLAQHATALNRSLAKGEDPPCGVLADAYTQVEKLDEKLAKLGKRLGLNGNG
jgi:hypothetical protein